MNLKEILTELRSNPKQNLQKIAGHQEAIQFLKSKGCTRYHDNGYAVSMTSLPKLGVNPKSPYNTPIGIYFYDAAHYIERKEDDHYLNFQDGAAYIQIFKYRDDAEIINIDEVDVDEYNRYIQMLFSSTEIPTILGISQKQVTDVLVKAMAESHAEARIKSYGGYLWYVLMSLSQSREIGSRKNAGVASRSAVIWNRLIRILKIDVIIDYGSSIIHENEPDQGVVLNPRAIVLVNTIANTTPRKRPPVIPAKKGSVPANKKSEGTIHYAAKFAFYDQLQGKYQTETIKVYALNNKDAKDIAFNLLGIDVKDLVSTKVTPI
jgi:hypothetical protein